MEKTLAHATAPYNDTFDTLFIIPDGQLQMTGDDTLFLVISGCVPGELQNLCGKVLKHCSEIDYRDAVRYDPR